MIEEEIEEEETNEDRIYKPEELTFCKWWYDVEQKYCIFFSTEDDYDNLRDYNIGAELLESCGLDPNELSENTFETLIPIDQAVENLISKGFIYDKSQNEYSKEDFHLYDEGEEDE